MIIKIVEEEMIIDSQILIIIDKIVYSLLLIIKFNQKINIDINIKINNIIQIMHRDLFVMLILSLEGLDQEMILLINNENNLIYI